MRLTTIGTGTAAPHPTRVASAQLIETGEIRLLLDCGSGTVHRMASLGIDWRAITHVALTHFHADHVTDLVMLVMAWRWGQLPPRDAPLTLYGPKGTGELLERLSVMHGAWMLAPGFPFTVRENEPHEVCMLPGDVALSAHPVPHTDESVAYSVSANGRRIVYTGDTGYDETVAAWASGCDLLLAECSLPDALAVASHLTPRQVGAMAAIAKPARLVLTHFYPPVEQVDIEAEIGEHYRGPVTRAHDGWTTEL